MSEAVVRDEPALIFVRIEMIESFQQCSWFFSILHMILHSTALCPKLSQSQMAICDVDVV